MGRAFDWLLSGISQDVTSDEPQGGPYRITVLAGGHMFTGQVVSHKRFLEEFPAEKRPGRWTGLDEDEARYQLHLLADQGPGISPQNKQVVRFWSVNIEAWWVA
ncbi:hypothetical protein [Streptomyces pseudogriseolus]|uniref:hypothetical protein n=1 Tax=Streptomyces pseudogriseolus TaxID=36817 RepID=UPI003FA26253